MRWAILVLHDVSVSQCGLMKRVNRVGFCDLHGTRDSRATRAAGNTKIARAPLLLAWHCGRFCSICRTKWPMDRCRCASRSAFRKICVPAMEHRTGKPLVTPGQAARANWVKLVSLRLWKTLIIRHLSTGWTLSTPPDASHVVDSKAGVGVLRRGV